MITAIFFALLIGVPVIVLGALFVAGLQGGRDNERYYELEEEEKRKNKT